MTNQDGIVLQTAGVTKRFEGLVAVDGFDFAVQAGEIRGIVGPNGAGKTTLFNLISGLYAPTAGRIHLFGHDVTAKPPHVRAARGLGRTYQTPQVFRDLNLFDNVAVGRSCLQHPSVGDAVFGSVRSRRPLVEDAIRALEFCGLPPDLHARAGEISFARQKRLELARMLMGSPKVALLDEPAAGLNSAEVAALVDVIKRVRDTGITVVLIEHNMRFVMGLCDRVTVLDFGRKIAEGVPDVVRRDPAVIDAYLGSGHAGV